jgi:CheY-like chemotaxis protein
MSSKLKIDATDVPIAKFDLGGTDIKLACLEFVPQVVAETRCVLPTDLVQNQLTVVMADPGDDKIVNEIEFASGLSVKRVFLPYADLETLVREAYAHKAMGERYLRPQKKKRRKSDHPPSLRPRAPEPKKIILDASDKADEAARAKEAAEAAPRDPAVILLLGAAGEDRDALGQSLADTGDAFVMFDENALSGLATARDEKPDIVIVDWVMEGMSGLEVTHHLRNDPRFAKPAVLLAGVADASPEQVRDFKKQYGVSGYFKRPFDLGEIFRTVVQLTADRKPRDRSAPEPDSPHAERVQQMLDRSAKAHKSGEHAISLDLLRQAVKLDPIDYKTRYTLALLLAQTSADNEAVTELGVCISMRPNHFDAHKTLALLLDRLGRTVEAAAAFEAALPLAPTEEHAAPLRARFDALKKDAGAAPG